MTKNLIEALEKQRQQTEQFNQKISGILGIPLGGQRRVEVAGRNAYVYVRLRSNQSEVIQAYNNTVATSYNLPVLVERQGNRYVVVSVDTQRYDNNWNSNASFLPRHGNTHSFDIESGGGGDIVWVYPRQITPVLVMPSGSSGAENVIVNPYILMDNSGAWKYVGNTGTSSLAPYRPTSPTGAVMALVYLDVDSGNPYLLINSGTVFSNTITGSSQIFQYIPTISNQRTQIPLAAIRLITGTNQISWDNIYDTRQFFRANNLGPSENIYFLTSGSAGVGGFDLMTDERPTNSYNYYSASISSTGTMIADFITESGVPNASFISDGIYHLHVHAQVTAGTKDARLKYLFGKYSSGGVKTLLHSSELSNTVTSTEEEFDIEQIIDEHSLETTDRLWLEIYGFQEGLGTAPTVRLKVEGDTFSRFEIPALATQGGGISSIPIQDEGVSVGSATTFNFVGDGVQATISGSVARVNVSGGSVNTGTLDARYLKLDASNAPVLAPLTISGSVIVSTPSSKLVGSSTIHSGTTNTTNEVLLTRSANISHTGVAAYEGYGFYLQDTNPLGKYVGGVLYHRTKTGRETFINPYAPSGTVAEFISEIDVGTSGSILSLKNQGVQKFKVDGAGNTNIPTGSTYNVGGTPHTHTESMTLIASSELSADAASIDFQNIPQNYKNLIVIAYARTDQAGASDNVIVRFNNDAGNNYYALRTNIAHSASITTVEQLATGTVGLFSCAGDNAPANFFGPAYMVIPAYSNTINHKTTRAFGFTHGAVTTGNQTQRDASGVWKNISAINRITFSPSLGTNFKAGTRIYLYGA